MDGETPKPRMSKLERAKLKLAELQAQADDKAARDATYQRARAELKAAYNLCGRHEFEKSLEAVSRAEELLLSLAGLAPE